MLCLHTTPRCIYPLDLRHLSWYNGRNAELSTALTKPPSVQYNLENYTQELKGVWAANRAKENLKDEKEKAKRYYDKKTKNSIF